MNNIVGLYRRRMMMGALGSGVDVAAMIITGSCTFTDYDVVTMSDGNDYRLLVITQSGNIVFSEPVNVEVCVVGGGANGSSGTVAYQCRGGAGAYMKNQTIEAFEGGTVVVGAAQGISSVGDVSVEAVSDKNGGTGAGMEGTGDGLSKYPFGDDSYELWVEKPHCGGGGAGGVSELSGQDKFTSYSYGNGGTNGGNGGAYTYIRNYGTEHAPGGSGGLYGGGSGATATGISSSMKGADATYYGSGGGGGSFYGYYDGVQGRGGSGYQGIVYIRIPVIQ